MMRYLLLILTFVPAISSADTLINEYAAISKVFAGTPVGASRSITIPKRYIVVILKIEGDRALVEPDVAYWKMWIPLSNLAPRSSFKPITSWRGESTLEEDCGDTSVTYHFKPNGAFTAQVLGPSGKEPAIRGQLLQSGDIVWARRDDRKDLFWHGVLFTSPLGDTPCLPTAEEQ